MTTPGRILPIATMLVALAAGTAGSTPPAGGPQAVVSASGRVAIFVEGSRRVARSRPVEVASVEALPEGGSSVALTVQTEVLVPRKLAGGQEPLAAGALSPGLYRGIRVRLRAAKGAGGEAGAVVADLRADFRVLPHETTTLIVEWNLAAAYDEKGRLRIESLALERSGETVRSLTLYLTDARRDRVVAVNRDTDRVFAEIRVGREPRAVAFEPSGRRAYVANRGDDTVSVLDATRHRVEDLLRVRSGSAPVDLVVADGGRRLVVSCPGRQALAVLDVLTDAFLGEISLTRDPGLLAVGSDDRTVYALIPEGNQIVAVDTTSLRVLGSPVSVESRPSDLVVDPRRGTVYVAHSGAPVVSVLTSNLRLDRRLQLGTPAHGIALEPGGSTLYLSGGDAGDITLVSPEVGTMVRTIPSPPAYRMAVDPDGKKVYAVGGGSGKLLVVDRIAGRLAREVRAGGDLTDLAIAP